MLELILALVVTASGDGNPTTGDTVVCDVLTADTAFLDCATLQLEARS